MNRLVSFSLWFVSLRVVIALCFGADPRALIVTAAMAAVACALAGVISSLEPESRHFECACAVLVAPLVGLLLSVLTGKAPLGIESVPSLAIWFTIACIAWNIQLLMALPRYLYTRQTSNGQA
jgi:hypothetical protein